MAHEIENSVDRVDANLALDGLLFAATAVLATALRGGPSVAEREALRDAIGAMVAERERQTAPDDDEESGEVGVEELGEAHDALRKAAAQALAALRFLRGGGEDPGMTNTAVERLEAALGYVPGEWRSEAALGPIAGTE